MVILICFLNGFVSYENVASNELVIVIIWWSRSTRLSPENEDKMTVEGVIGWKKFVATFWGRRDGNTLGDEIPIIRFCGTKLESEFETNYSLFVPFKI